MHGVCTCVRTCVCNMHMRMRMRMRTCKRGLPCVFAWACVCVHAPRLPCVRVQVGLHCENGIFGAFFALLLWEVAIAHSAHTERTRTSLAALATLAALAALTARICANCSWQAHLPQYGRPIFP